MARDFLLLIGFVCLMTTVGLVWLLSWTFVAAHFALRPLSRPLARFSLRGAIFSRGLARFLYE